MLSRIAESLFWIGRYIERAEDTCRILDVHLQQLVEDPTLDQHESAASLLTAMGVEVGDLDEGTRVDQQLVMERLCYSPTSGTSLVSIMAAARGSARRARETVSVEMWEGINTTYHDVTANSFSRLRPVTAFKMVRERCAVISGLADQTMTHDEGWHFLALGRRIERVDMTARLMSIAAVNPLSQLAWSNALRACGAHHAFVRDYGGEANTTDAAGFLLLDRLFPRSIVATLKEAESSLAALEDATLRVAFTDKASLLLGRSRAQLEYRAPSDLLLDLSDRMVLLQEVCVEASQAVADRYFTGAAAAQWQRGAL